jgi:hypothetical protein
MSSVKVRNFIKNIYSLNVDCQVFSKKAMQAISSEIQEEERKSIINDCNDILDDMDNLVQKIKEFDFQ